MKIINYVHTIECSQHFNNDVLSLENGNENVDFNAIFFECSILRIYYNSMTRRYVSDTDEHIFTFIN